MSLMNDALRKKKRETTSSQPLVGFSDQGPRLRITRKMWMVVFGALLLLGSVAAGGLYLQHYAGNGSLRANRLLPPVSQSAFSPLANESQVPGQYAEADTMQVVAGGKLIVATDPIVGKNGVASDSPASEPSAATVAISPPPPRPTQSAPAMAPALEKPATRRENSPSAITEMATAESHRKSSRTFEPDPGRGIINDKHIPAAQPRSRSSAHTVAVAPLPASDQNSKTRKATVADDPDTDMFYRKALACHRNGRLEDAVRLYQQVLRSEPTHSEAMFNLAAAYIEGGSFNQARPLLIRLEHLTPRPDGVLLNLAITAIGTNAPSLALDYLDRAEKLADATPWEIRFHRAVALSHMNRFSDALTLYRELATQRPDDPRVQFNLAVTCDTMGLYPEALDHYESVLRASKASPPNDTKTIIARMGSIRRYLNTTYSQVKRQ